MTCLSPVQGTSRRITHRREPYQMCCRSSGPLGRPGRSSSLPEQHLGRDPADDSGAVAWGRGPEAKRQPGAGVTAGRGRARHFAPSEAAACSPQLRRRALLQRRPRWDGPARAARLSCSRSLPSHVVHLCRQIPALCCAFHFHIAVNLFFELF